MKNFDNILKKLLDNFILPKFEDIISYELSLVYDNVYNILFWMDGTDEETEKEIVYECQNILQYYDIPNVKVLYNFTVDGGNSYDYS
jgi:hypothetical protein